MIWSPRPLKPVSTDDEFIVSVRLNDGRHDGVPSSLEGRVVFVDRDSAEIIAWVDGLVRIDGGPNITWRGDRFQLRANTGKRPGGTSLFPAKLNGRDDDGTPILTDNLVCRLFGR
jgi:hypothetical protein